MSPPRTAADAAVSAMRIAARLAVAEHGLATREAEEAMMRAALRGLAELPEPVVVAALGEIAGRPWASAPRCSGQRGGRPLPEIVGMEGLP